MNGDHNMNQKRIAWELERTAMGDGYYGNALRVAKDLPGITPKDRSVLDRYATGTQTGTDHVHLQWLAQWLYEKDARITAPQPSRDDTALLRQALEALEVARPLKADYLTLEHYAEAKRKHYAVMAALRERLGA